tara:strand:+ start:308 stop:457 length:150 start_codon:yes stop_codon:yes gene_type:complete
VLLSALIDAVRTVKLYMSQKLINTVFVVSALFLNLLGFSSKESDTRSFL